MPLPLIAPFRKKKYKAIIRKKMRVWKEVIVRGKMDRCQLTIDGETVIVNLAVDTGDRLIYDVEEEDENG